MWCQKVLKSHPFSNIKPVGGLETVERVDGCAYVAFYCTTAVAFERCTAVLTSRLLSHILMKKSSDFFVFFILLRIGVVLSSFLFCASTRIECLTPNRTPNQYQMLNRGRLLGCRWAGCGCGQGVGACVLA